jgi:hypothetical protein
LIQQTSSHMKILLVTIVTLLIISMLITVYAIDFPCADKCFSEAEKLKGTEKVNALEQCKNTCLPNPLKHARNKRAKFKNMKHELKKFPEILSGTQQNLLKTQFNPSVAENQQSSSAILLNNNNNNNNKKNGLMTDTILSYGALLEANDNVNVRSGPCTAHPIVEMLYMGSRTIYTGKTQDACNYKWYSITNGWAVADFFDVIDQ